MENKIQMELKLIILYDQQQIYYIFHDYCSIETLAKELALEAVYLLLNFNSYWAYVYFNISSISGIYTYVEIKINIS